MESTESGIGSDNRKVERINQVMKEVVELKGCIGQCVCVWVTWFPDDHGFPLVWPKAVKLMCGMISDSH